jgi:hypothetical protein
VVTLGPLTLEQPLEIDDARRAANRLATQRRDAELALEAQVLKAADAEAAARKSYALAFVAAEGTAAEREAVARDKAGQAFRDRDIQAGMVKVMTERLRGLEGERSMLKSLIEWSQRMSADEHAKRAYLLGANA